MVSYRQLVVLSLSVLAASRPAPPAAPPQGGCMTADEAYQVGAIWAQLLGSFSKELARDTLAKDYTDYSESALTLNNICPQAPVASPPDMDPVFTNRTQFMEGQGMQKPIESTILNVWAACTTAVMRYEMTNTTDGGQPVVGIIAIETVPAPQGNKYPYLIKETYSEFDVGSWVENLQAAGTCTKSS